MRFIYPNEIHRLFHNPRNRWDPISESYARWYSERAWSTINKKLVDQLEIIISGFQGKRVLDLGGGPGQYSVEFAKRGAFVTWHDISSMYLKIAREKACENNVQINFNLGYFEDICYSPSCSYDFVFSHVCWYYCMDDGWFAKMIFRLIQPNGYTYIMTPTAESYQPRSFLRKLQYYLNTRYGIKIGHPLPPSGRIKTLFLKCPIRLVGDNNQCGETDILFFKKLSDCNPS